MKDIVPSDSRYTPLTQQRYCCVPTCIQIVMLKHNIPLISQELIGYHLGLVVPKEDLQYFWNARSGKRPKAGYGTRIFKKEYDPNRAFSRLKIPLKISYQFIDKFHSLNSLQEYLGNIGKGDKDVLACFNYGSLYNTDSNNGHVCVVDKIYLNKGKIRLIDPERNSPKWRVVNIKKLFEAMKRHGRYRGGGFWELSKK